MRKIIPALTVTIALLWAVTAPLTAHASAHVNWTARTCTAAGAYMRHPSQARLAELAADSVRVPWKYLGEDVWQLVKDARTHSRGYDDAAQYVYGDCHNGYGF